MRSWIVGLCGVLVIGCGDDSPGSSGTDATESTTADTSSSSGNTSPSSSSASATDSASESSGSESSTSTGGSESTSLDPETDSSGSSSSGESSSSTTMVMESTSSMTDPPMTGSSEDTGGLLSNGEQCMANDQCQSGACYLSGVLGGICGECLDDDDCVWGCGAPAPLAEPPTGSTCDDGGVGAGCQTDAACQMTLACAEIINVPGVVEINGCSECMVDADCDELCTPVYDFVEFEGHWECIAADSLALGSACDYAGSGDAACDSGFCAVADIMGILQIGVCSECEVDLDCGPGGTCDPPQVELDNTLTPGACL